MSILEVVSNAVEDAQNIKIKSIDDPGLLHRERSKNFVECLSDRLLESCGGISNIASLSKHQGRDRKKFGMNELLFDVAVVKYGMVNSGSSRKELAFVERCLWAVESEMARDKRQALFDFNKLVLAAAENVLFVGPRVSDEPDYLRVLEEPAANCTGRVKVALIPHPDAWPEKGPQDVVAWKWISGRWAALASAGEK